MNTFQEKKEKLHHILKSGGKPGIAFSGGVDSSLLLFLAAQLRNSDALGVFAVTAAQSDAEKEKAMAFCKEYNLPLEVVTVDIFGRQEVAKNHRDRCYHCKKEILTAIAATAKQNGCTVIYDGSIADDKEEYRPGTKALEEAKVESPLQASGFTKTNVRNYASNLGLKNWNKPSTPCLLTRFPYELPMAITERQLQQIEKGEAFLSLICRHNYRLRWEGENQGRIEASKEDMTTILEAKQEVLEALGKIGFTKVALDLRPFKSGSFDRE